jgi:hypothetical protein
MTPKKKFPTGKFWGTWSKHRTPPLGFSGPQNSLKRIRHPLRTGLADPFPIPSMFLCHLASSVREEHEWISLVWWGLVGLLLIILQDANAKLRIKEISFLKKNFRTFV